MMHTTVTVVVYADDGRSKQSIVHQDTKNYYWVLTCKKLDRKMTFLVLAYKHWYPGLTVTKTRVWKTGPYAWQI